MPGLCFAVLLTGLFLGFWCKPATARVRERSGHAALLASMPLSPTSWLSGSVLGGPRMQLAKEPWRPLLERYLEPYRNHTPEWRGFFFGEYGPAHAPWLPSLCWGTCESAPAAPELDLPRIELAPELTLQAVSFEPRASLDVSADWFAHAPAPELLNVSRHAACPRWKAPRPVTILRYAGEGMRAALTDCDGAIAPDVLDELSVLARPAGTARPALPLPLDPVGEAGEWTDDVRLLEPRLVWVLSEIARSFPGHAIVIQSGYRREAHSSQHAKGRALDLYVQGVPNESLFGVCRALHDTGCGYYPKNQFVHVDVRPYGTGRVGWVDISEPGEPSQYVDGWPGVLAPGSGWLGRDAR